MNTNQVITLSAGLFLCIALIVLAVPKPAYSGIPFSLGCCISENGTSECLGCGEQGENCAIPQLTCLEELGGTFFEGESFCSVGLPGANCFNSGETPGCCINGPGSCEDGVVVSSCGGDQWFISEDCSDIPQCEVTTADVPALSQWGIIAIAAILGVVGFIVIRRRTATAGS